MLGSKPGAVCYSVHRMMGVTEEPKRYKIRRKIVFFLILMSILYSCGGIGMKGGYPWRESKRQILAWATSEKTKVDRGALKNSEYWIQFYQKTMELRPDLDDFLVFANEMIKVSRIFEEGKITKEQFEDKHRQLTALLAKEESRRAEVFSSDQLRFLDIYEAGLFTCYRGSLFLDYVNDLQRQLKVAGPQLSRSHCTFFDNSIKCTTQKPPFLD